VKIKREHLLTIMDRAEIDHEALRDYSGRGMYGRSCPGITVDDQETLFRFFAAAGAIEAEQEEDADLPDGAEFNAFELAEGVATDSMYRSMIFYWPRLEIVE
jgi:hypothetical protein